MADEDWQKVTAASVWEATSGRRSRAWRRQAAADLTCWLISCTLKRRGKVEAQYRLEHFARSERLFLAAATRAMQAGASPSEIVAALEGLPYSGRAPWWERPLRTERLPERAA